MNLRLDQHVEFIAELSVNATKELAIENNIKNISTTWSVGQQASKGGRWRGRGDGGKPCHPVSKPQHPNTE